MRYIFVEIIQST